MNLTVASDIDDYISGVRKQFPILRREVNGKPLVYLDNGATTQKPELVLNAMDSYYRFTNANVHRGVHRLSQEATDAFEAARRKVATFFGVEDANQIIFTRGTTESVNIVAAGIAQSLRTGDEILISGMEHHSNIVPWQMACKRSGASLKVIPVTDSGELDMEEFDNLLSNRTKIVSVVHVSNALGTINPVEQIIEKAHKIGALVMLDGAQSAAHFPINLTQLNCDFFACSGHKLFGPTGIGILYGKRSALEALPPYQGGGEMIREVTFEKTTYNDIPFKFEAGTPSIAEAIGLGAAVDFITRFDHQLIAMHEARLLEAATKAVAKHETLRIIGQAPSKVSIISFTGHKIHPYDLGTLLDQQGIAVRTGHHCTQPLMARFGVPGTVRASFSIYNTLEEVQHFEQALDKAVKMLS